ncbi:hypothetical protein GGR57DRAFT_425209 [Xylariaceae sp. FL1272]|nr:hypothetical protein GGR57DRAFT_425209 [Xylariaceae sp. FL1272]
MRFAYCLSTFVTLACVNAQIHKCYNISSVYQSGKFWLALQCWNGSPIPFPTTPEEWEVYHPEDVRKYSAMNLDHCLGNSHGNLVGQEEGKFTRSCSDITLSGTTISAVCDVGPKKVTQTSSIDLNDIITLEYPGNPWCFGKAA